MVFMRRLILFFILMTGLFSFFCQSESVKENGKSDFPIDGDEVIPRKYKSIYIHNFTNESYSGELTGEIKEILTQKMGMQQRFKIEPEKLNADVWLYGKIEYYQLTPEILINLEDLQNST